MESIKRLGLGCMGMSLTRSPKRSIETVHKAIDEGITFLNTGNFYNCGGSEMLLGRALNGISRDKYFLSVKFGGLISPDGKFYGLDVNPFHFKAQLNYSLKRLGVDYVDLYQPCRMDAKIPIEDIMSEMVDLKEKGFIRHIGLTEIDAATLRKAHAIHLIYMIELEYSLIDREIEEELLPTAKELGIKVLLFGAMGHGLLNDSVLEGKTGSVNMSAMLSPENLPKNLPLVRKLKEFAQSKNVSLSQLMLAWTLKQQPKAMALIGTTSPDHLQDNIKALSIELTDSDMQEINSIASSHTVYGNAMRSLKFSDGRAYFEE